MSNYSNLISKYYETLKRLQSEGVDNEFDARALASQIACRDFSSSSNELMNLKSQSDAVAYHLHGTEIDILEVKVANPTRHSKEQLKIKFQKRVGHRLKAAEFKGDQALRVIILILLKFERYDDDVRGGFDYGEISQRENELVKCLSNLGHEISLPQHENDRSTELVRNIKTKFLRNLQLDGFVSNYRETSGYRFEIAGHHFAFREKALHFLNSISEDAIDAYQARFDVEIRRAS